jgi:hypothetical protein
MISDPETTMRPRAGQTRTVRAQGSVSSLVTEHRSGR